MARAREAFTEISDIFHAFIGFLSAFNLLFPYGWISSLLIALIFFVYEALEGESPLCSYFDLVEFLCGFALGLIVALGLRFGGGV
jgi:hypothetical protein